MSYAVDVVSDPELAGFYERLAMKRAVGMVQRHLQNQPGATP